MKKFLLPYFTTFLLLSLGLEANPPTTDDKTPQVFKNLTLLVDKEDMKFSAGHFTIFSKTLKERLHGHNFSVSASFTYALRDDTLLIDYNVFKNIIRNLCKELDEYILFPLHSKHLVIETNDKTTTITHHESTYSMPSDEVKLLPISNITIEELAEYLLSRTIKNLLAMNNQNLMLSEVKLGVSSGPGQTAYCQYVFPLR